MQTLKAENNSDSGSCKGTPERKIQNRAQNREKALLTFVINATARDQEKHILISRLQRELSEAVKDYEALKTEVKIKDQILHAKEEELLVMKSENEALKQQLQELLLPKKTETTSSGIMKIDDDETFLKPSKSVNLKRRNTDVCSPSKSPRPTVSRKRSIKKTKDITEKIFYNLRKKAIKK